MHVHLNFWTTGMMEVKFSVKDWKDVYSDLFTADQAVSISVVASQTF